jgi:hypothetical protein
MTYDQLLTARANLESALLTGDGAQTVTIGDHSVTYRTHSQIERALAQVNRSIARYRQQAAGQVPGIRTAGFS